MKSADMKSTVPIKKFLSNNEVDRLRGNKFRSEESLLAKYPNIKISSDLSIKINRTAFTNTLKNYAQTGSEYTKILNQIITQNRLSDFEPVRLVNSVKQVELNS